MKDWPTHDYEGGNPMLSGVMVSKVRKHEETGPRIVRYVRQHWLRSLQREWNQRQLEQGHTAAIIPLATRRKSLRGLLRVAPADARWALALWICPEIREELTLR